MSDFRQSIITDSGRALIAKVMSGETLSFTKICTSSYNYLHHDVENLTALLNIEQTVEINSVRIKDEEYVSVSGIINNTELEEGYYLNTIGLYALDPDVGEILYSVTCDSSPDWIPENNSRSATNLIIELLTKVNNSAEITINVSGAGVITAADIVNNLESADATRPLSANMGRHLHELDYIIEESGGYMLRNGSTGKSAPGNFAVDLSYCEWVEEGVIKGATGFNSFAEGLETKASGYVSHAEGHNSKAEGEYSHAEGLDTEASGYVSHAEGYESKAEGMYSHAEGESTTASGSRSHAEGEGCDAIGFASHAEGYNTEAIANCSHTSGRFTQANAYASFATGYKNKELTGDPTAYSGTADAFVIGNGSLTTANNAFRVTFDGKVYGLSAFNSTGADYAEFFEWEDGNPDNEDRVGYFVTLDGDKIRKATATDDYILGAVSVNPSVIGDSHQDDWYGKFVKDEWGRIQYHWVDVPAEYDEEGKEIKPATREYVPVLNSDWNPNEEYIPRENRPEWAAVGIMGKLLVRDDGSCVVNGYCSPNNDGIATASPAGFRVIKRISDSIVQIFIK